MAGIGFELRKLYRKQGLIHNLKAYAFSTMTTVGPMILCLLLVIAQQLLLKRHDVSYLQNELFVATLAYCFVFSIVLTSGFSMLMTRYIADAIYEKKYDRIIDTYYGSIICLLPIAAVIAIVFLAVVEGSFLYKVVAYVYFMELITIWLQNVFLSALKDYVRIVKGFLVAVTLSIATSIVLYEWTTLEPIIVALLGMNVGFASFIISASLHFEHVFPRSEKRHYFGFLRLFTSHRTLFFSGLFVYSSVYIHNLIYWFFSEDAETISSAFQLMSMYDVPVFYAYLTVLPSLIFFVVVIETDFYERFLNYYKNVIDNGTYESLQIAKRKMQKVLLYRIGFLAEIQLLFTTLGIASGLLLLPRFGVTLAQIDIFITLCLAYFFFILMFILLHILMYFDDRKGIFLLSFSFIVVSAIATFITMKLNMHGFGFFIAAFLLLSATFIRLLYILKHIDYYTYCPQPMMTIQSTKRTQHAKAIVSVLALILLSGCTAESVTDQTGTASTAVVPAPTTIDTVTIDDKRIYERDVDESIKTFYITVLPDSENPSLDWYSLNRIVERYSEDNLKIILQEGAPNNGGPSPHLFGGQATTANAKISLRGNSARNFPQKSYKINLLDSAGVWHDQKTINLNKHLGDDSRLRNKLSFDLMETIPNISSLRTQFIHLYVKDVTAGETTFIDYGLYTHVEQPNKTFLKNHLFDRNGYLYKVTFFEFQRYPEQIKLESDPTFDQQAFESILEIKGNTNHEKLITLLNDVNNYSIPIQQIIDYYFVEDNLLTWLAVNILMDNIDTDANNYYLYSPLNTNKWLILPWDYDDGWNQGRKNKNFNPHRNGLSNYWNNILFKRYFSTQENVDKLTAKIEYLHAHYINEQTVQQQLTKYVYIPRTYIQRMPDVEHLQMVASDYEKEIESIIATPATAKERYYLDLQRPKPFFQSSTVELVNDEHLFTWSNSFDLQGDTLFYNVIVAKDPALTNVIASKTNIRETEIRVPQLPSGSYYLYVTVHDEYGNENTSFDMVRDRENDINYFGVMEVVIP